MKGNKQLLAPFISDDGYINTNPTSSVNNTTANSLNNLDETPINPLLDSFGCGNLVPLGCYEDVNGTIIVSPPGSPCYQTSQW